MTQENFVKTIKAIKYQNEIDTKYALKLNELIGAESEANLALYNNEPIRFALLNAIADSFPLSKEKRNLLECFIIEKECGSSDCDIVNMFYMLTL
jgi:hypothetical protein